MLKKLVASAVVVTLAGGGLLVGISSAEAGKAAKAPALSAPAKAQVGKAFHIVVRTKHQRGKVVLQRKNAAGHWKRVAATRARASVSRVKFRRVESRAGRYAYRAKLGQRFSPVDRVLVKSPPPPPPQLFISVGADTLDVFVNQVYTVSVETVKGDAPLAGRPVVIERWGPDDAGYLPFESGTTGSDGIVSFSDSSDTIGPVSYRATSGSLTGETMVMVFEQVSMPKAAGPGMAMTTSRPCAASIVASGSGVGLRMVSKAVASGPPNCPLRVDDYVQARWSLPRSCVPVKIANIAIGGSDGVRARVGLWVDGQAMELDQDTLGKGQSTGALNFSGDPMRQVVIRITADRVPAVAANKAVSLTGVISRAVATCGI